MIHIHTHTHTHAQSELLTMKGSDLSIRILAIYIESQFKRSSVMKG